MGLPRSYPRVTPQIHNPANIYCDYDFVDPRHTYRPNWSHKYSRDSGSSSKQRGDRRHAHYTPPPSYQLEPDSYDKRDYNTQLKGTACCDKYQKQTFCFFACPVHGPEAITTIRAFPTWWLSPSNLQPCAVDSFDPTPSQQYCYPVFDTDPPYSCFPYPTTSYDYPSYLADISNNTWYSSPPYQSNSMPSYTSTRSQESNGPSLQHLEPSPGIHNLRDLRNFVDHASKNATFIHFSEDLLITFTASTHVPILHIQPENNPDHLLRLHLLLHAIKPLNQYIAKRRTTVGAKAIVVVDSINNHHQGFSQACWVVSHESKDDSSNLQNERVMAFGNIVVIRGSCGGNECGRAVLRIIAAIKTTTAELHSKDFVWHECAGARLLSRFLSMLSKEGRSIKDHFKGIAMTSGLSIDEEMCVVKMEDKLARDGVCALIQRYNIPLLLIDENTLELADPYAEPLTWQDMRLGKWSPHANMLLNLSSRWNSLLPMDAAEPIIRQCMNDLAVEVYRLRAKVERVYEQKVVDSMQKELTKEKALPWIRRANQSESYTKLACQEQKVEQALIKVGQYVEAPLDFQLDAVVGGLLDRGRPTDNLIALRVDIDWKRHALRLNSNNHIPLYLLVQKSGHSQALHTDMSNLWVNFISDTFANAPVQAYKNNGFWASWDDLIRVVKMHIKVMLSSQSKTWSKQEIDIAERILVHCRHGSMDHIRRASNRRR
ncbi:hypothetical protein EJ08DRAFT_365263 [Tothia fuscella]|uniref:Uncharacterized protein n=1 Tax=Tothia fuscella TaxID=1048955 RepID=A0A9P4NLB6_9PEZI|nr:hypothetical protein EJ08DRAFT_365263 [Tothia fuscella]